MKEATIVPTQLFHQTKSLQNAPVEWSKIQDGTCCRLWASSAYCWCLCECSRATYMIKNNECLLWCKKPCSICKCKVLSALLDSRVKKMKINSIKKEIKIRHIWKKIITYYLKSVLIISWEHLVLIRFNSHSMLISTRVHHIFNKKYVFCLTLHCAPKVSV